MPLFFFHFTVIFFFFFDFALLKVTRLFLVLIFIALLLVPTNIILSQDLKAATLTL